MRRRTSCPSVSALCAPVATTIESLRDEFKLGDVEAGGANSADDLGCSTDRVVKGYVGFVQMNLIGLHAVHLGQRLLDVVHTTIALHS